MDYFDSADVEGAYLNSLADFCSLPPPGFIAIGEVNEQFEIVNSFRKNSAGFESVFERYLENHIPVSNEIKNSTTQAKKIPSLIKTSTSDSFLIEPDVSGFKGIWAAWMEGGLNTLDAIEKLGIPSVVIAGVRALIKASFTARNSKRVVKTLLFPHLKMSNEEMINEFAGVRDWSTSWVRAMCWHPRLPRLALALHDDSVKIFVHSQPSSVLPVFKAPEQKSVSCIAWHPYVTEFVLGVEGGFLLWTLHPPIKKSNPTSKFVPTVNLGHAPVTCIGYSRNGEKLLSCSAADTSIFIWCLSTGSKVPLYRLSSGGVPRAAFSPNPVTEIFSNTPSRDFRFWEYDNSVLKPKSWTTAKLPVEAFAWHPSGQHLFFATDGLLFRLTMNFTADHIIDPVFDLGEISIPQQSTSRALRVGGKVIQIEWDPSGKRLAILFADCSCVAILRLLPGKNTCLVPCGFITGEEAEYPVAIAFQKDFEHGALLTIAWSSERIQYFPFLFTPLLVPDVQTSLLNPQCRIFSTVEEAEQDNAVEFIDKEPYFGTSGSGGAGDSFKLFSEKFSS